jgi:tetratricopeptide (TPR) repeat protein
MASTLTELADSFKHQWNDEGSTFQYTEKECDVEKAKEKAEEFKVLGNTYFKQNRFDDAATAYTKAIECCERLDEPGMVDSLHVYFCNRALTALKLENYGVFYLF